MKRFQERASDRVLSDDELRALWKGLDAHSGRASDAIRLRLLLGQRGQEVVGMKWNEIDFVAKTWDMPGGRTKNRRRHCVPLPPTALALLKRRRQSMSASESCVFPGLTAWTDDYRALSQLTGGAYEWKDLRQPSAPGWLLSASTKKPSAGRLTMRDTRSRRVTTSSTRTSPRYAAHLRRGIDCSVMSSRRTRLKKEGSSLRTRT